MKTIKILDKKFDIQIRGAQVKTAIANVADRINADYQGKEILFVAVLNGAFMFATDLVRKITLPCHISFVKVASYRGDTPEGIVRELIGLREDLNDKHVILIEDIIDTGFTYAHIMEQIRSKYKPASIAIASLLFKPQSYRKPLSVDYVGFEIPNDFVVGYGLDYHGYGRNLENIYTVVN